MKEWGGKRPNAGRKPLFDEPTVYRQIPVRWVESFEKWIARMKKKNNG